jgi:hypothetical protein
MLRLPSQYCGTSSPANQRTKRRGASHAPALLCSCTCPRCGVRQCASRTNPIKNRLRVGHYAEHATAVYSLLAHPIGPGGRHRDRIHVGALCSRACVWGIVGSHGQCPAHRAAVAGGGLVPPPRAGEEPSVMKRQPRVLLGTIGCVVLLATIGCGGKPTTGPAHPTTIIHPSVGPFSGQIDPAYSYMAISAGYEHTCGLDTSGRAYCWGGNTDGDLGDGTMMQSSRPVAVMGGHVFPRSARDSIKRVRLARKRIVASYFVGATTRMAN